MSDLRELYQEVILDHGRKPRNFRKLEEPDHTADGYNPLCGDKITLFLKVVDGLIEDVCFQGVGCAISTASASMMTQAVKGRRVEDVLHLFENFHDVVTGHGDGPEAAAKLGKLAAFAGVSEFPMRVKCATLAWHTLKAALEGEQETVSTE